MKVQRRALKKEKVGLGIGAERTFVPLGLFL